MIYILQINQQRLLEHMSTCPGHLPEGVRTLALDLAQKTGWPRAREMVQIHGVLAHFSASFVSSMVYQANKPGCRKKRVYNKYISPVELMTKSQEMPLL